MRTAIHVALLAVTVSSAPALAGCRGDISDEPPVVLQRNMFDQERYNPQSPSKFFADHRTMRTPVEGTFVHYDDAEDERFADTSEIATGLVADGSAYVVTVPQSVVDRAGGLKPLVERGQERFNIYCAPCHSKKGDGQGTVAKRGFPGVKNLGETSIREMTDGQLYATITRGKTTMPSYAAQVPVKDRWAIVAYVRALQLSLPPQETK